MSRAEPVPGPAGPQHCPLGFQYKFWETLDTIFKCLRNCFSHQQSDASSGNPSPAARPPTLAQTMSQHRSHGPLRFYSQPLCNLVPPTSTVCIRQGLAANRTGANRAYQTAHIVSPTQWPKQPCKAYRPGKEKEVCCWDAEDVSYQRLENVPNLPDT